MTGLEQFQLKGKVAVVTGAMGKLGAAWMEALAGAGAKVAALDLVGSKPSEAFQKLQQQYGADHIQAFAASVTDKDNLLSVRTAIEQQLGAVDVLVNNAGIDQPPNAPVQTYKLEDFPKDIFAKVLEVNLVGTFLCMQVFGVGMAQRKTGSIINIGSLYASVSPDARFYNHTGKEPPMLKPPVYGASKAALVQLTKYFAAHWGPANVRVNTLSPGGIEGGQDPEFKRKFTERVPLGRMGEITDLRGPLLFLASDASAYVTGINLQVDGGFVAW